MDVILKAGLINSACYPMECNNNQVSMPEQSCAYLVSNTLYLNPCETNYFCQIGFETSYCIPYFEVPIPLSYPGEPCLKSSDCIYGICNYGYCQGQQQGFPCSLSAECAPGLYCKGGDCIDLISAGSGTCVTDFECVNSAGCLDGICVAYFSLAVGASVSVCASQFSEFCSTGTCWQDVCIDALTSNNSLPVKCNSYFDCTSSLDNGVIFYSDCVCGNNPAGQSYCSLFSGDDYYALYISSLSNWLSSDVSRLCNTVRRFTQQCIQMFWDKPNYQEYLLYYYKTFSYPQIQNNDECVSEIYTNYYWELIQEITYSRYLFIGISLIVFLA